MPDGSVGVSAPQQEVGREGIIARASEKLQKFREAIKALFTKEGGKKVNGKDASRVEEILAIAEEDVARVKKDSAPLEKILEEAKASLTGVALKGDLIGAVEGLKKNQKEAVERALKEYREALVEVLKEGEKAEGRSEQAVSEAGKGETGPAEASMSQTEKASEAEGQPVTARAEIPQKEKRTPRSKKNIEEGREPWMDDIDAHFTRDFRADEDLLAAVLAYKKPSEHVKEYEALIDAASQAHTALNRLRRHEGSADEQEDLRNFQSYEQAIKAVEAAAEAYVALSEPHATEKVPATVAANAPEEKPVTPAAEDVAAEESFITDVLDTLRPQREDLKGPFERMMLLAGQVDALFRRAQKDEGQKINYQEELAKLRALHAQYRALEKAEPVVGAQVVDDEEGVEVIATKPQPVRDIADLAKALRNSPVNKKESQRPDPALTSEATGPVQVPAEVAERLKADTERRTAERAEQEAKDVIRLVTGLLAEKKRDSLALAGLFKGDDANKAMLEKLVDEDLRVHTARWLVDFMDGQFEMVRLPANEVWEERTNADGVVTKAMAANEADDDEYKKTAVMESRYAVAAVVKAGTSFGFKDEQEIRAVAGEALPSEQKGGIGSFVMDAAKALGKDQLRKELQMITSEIESTNAKLRRHALKLAILDGGEVQALEVRRDELVTKRKQIMEELTGNQFESKKQEFSSLMGLLHVSEEHLAKAQEGVRVWKDATEVDGDIKGWIAWFDGLVTAQKNFMVAAPAEREAALNALEAQIDQRPGSGHAKAITGWLEDQRREADALETAVWQRGGSAKIKKEAEAKRAYIDEVVDPRADVFNLVRGFDVKKLKEILDQEKVRESRPNENEAVIHVEADDVVDGHDAHPEEEDGPIVELIADEIAPEKTRTGIDTFELKTRTEAARAMIDSVKTAIAGWGKDRLDSVGQEYYIKDAAAYLERIIGHDEAFLALAAPTEDDERAYNEKRKAMVEGDLKREYGRLFVQPLKGSKRPYNEEFPAWITNAKKRAEAAGAKGDQNGRKREEAYAREIEKRKEVIDAIRPFFEVWLKMEAKEATVKVPDVATATPDASAVPKAPDAASAPADATPPVPPEATPAVPPPLPKTPDVTAAPVPPAAPPAAPPAPDKKAKGRPEPAFANEALFEKEDREQILVWLKKHGSLVDEAKKFLHDDTLEEARSGYTPFAEHATLLDNIVEVTTQLTQVKTAAERIRLEAILMSRRQKALGSMHAEVELEELESEKDRIKSEMNGLDDVDDVDVAKRKKKEYKEQLEKIKQKMSLVEMDAKLERALREVATLEGEQDVDTIKNALPETERREKGAETDWKSIIAEADEAFSTLSENMEIRKRPEGSERYFGSLYDAFLHDEERTIALNRALRTFNVLDSAEVHVTQTLRVLDREGSGVLSAEAWDEMPTSVQDYLTKAGENEKSTVESIKTKLYERLRAITRSKVEADKELQAQLAQLDALKESAYTLAEDAHAQLQNENRQLLRQLSQLRAEIEIYKPEKAKREAERFAYATRTQELKARLELLENEQAYANALLKDSEALLDISKRTLSGQGKRLNEASATEVLKNQKAITEVLVRVMNGQAALGARRKDEIIREQVLRERLPSTPLVQGGGASFGKGTPAPENRTSGSKGEKEKSVFDAFKETTFFKGMTDLWDAFTNPFK